MHWRTTESSSQLPSDCCCRTLAAAAAIVPIPRREKAPSKKGGAESRKEAEEMRTIPNSVVTRVAKVSRCLGKGIFHRLFPALHLSRRDYRLSRLARRGSKAPGDHSNSGSW